MKCLYNSLIIFFIYASSLPAQMKVTIDKKDFKTDKPGFDEVWKHIRKEILTITNEVSGTPTRWMNI